MRTFFARYAKQITLRRRMVLIFVASTLVPFLCVFIVSYHTMATILSTNLENGVRSNLRQIQLSLEHTISNLNHVSQQLSYKGSVGKKLEHYLAATESFERVQLAEEIRTELNLITFTNPNIGLVFYYFADDNKFIFQNTGVKDEWSLDNLPLLDDYYQITYFGPHISNERYNNQYVISALRKIDLPERDDVYVYIETAFALTQNILANDRFARDLLHLILDKEDRIAYSEVQDLYPVNEYFRTNVADSGQSQRYYWFKGKSNQGWSVMTLIPINEYNKEKNRWVVRMVNLSLVFGLLSMAVSWFLWRMVYRPLQQFNQEIRSLALSHAANRDSLTSTNIPEFDFLIKQLRNMKHQIANLIQEVQHKEQSRADLEVEKLLHQINPHFLMNTLDTVHWLAVMNGQQEIDRLVTSLNKLLYYNLGKLGRPSTIREELDSVRQYLNLQKIRYDLEFDVRISIQDDMLDTPVPRFILQPLLENALYHGLDDDKGYILLEVKSVDESVIITVRDNGKGMPEEELWALLNREQTEQRKTGLGIGLNYVKRVIENQYGDRATLEISSESGKGTTVRLTLPVPEVNRHD